MIKRSISLFLAVLFMMALPVQALAKSYDLKDGSIIITTTDAGQSVSYGGTDVGIIDPDPVIFQSNSETATEHRIVIQGDGVANVTIDGVNISSDPDAPIEVKGTTEVNLTISGSNTVTCNNASAGVEVKAGSLIITEESDGSLIAYGGERSAGIGGRDSSSVGTITINGGTVTAYGGDNGAGIGGGNSAGNIVSVTVNGGDVTAYGGENGAGIGGGNWGDGDVTINGGDVAAYGGENAAGIGGGNWSYPGTNVTITGGDVAATGGDNGAGIGGGISNVGGNVTIDGGNVTVTSGSNAEGIGNGKNGEGSASSITNANVTVDNVVISTAKETQNFPPAPTVVVEAEKTIDVTVADTSVEVRVWISGKNLDPSDHLIVDACESRELTESVEQSDIIGIYNLSLESRLIKLTNATLNFNLGTEFAGQVFALVYIVNGDKVEVESTVDANGILSFPLTQMTVVMLVKK